MAELKTISDATSGAMTLPSYDFALSGTSSDIAAALSGNFTGYSGNITLTDANPTAANLKIINDATATAYSGTAAELAAAFAGFGKDSLTGRELLLLHQLCSIKTISSNYRSNCITSMISL